MQDLNEAWRVLRVPASRAAYDRSLRAPPPRPEPVADDDGDDDRPYPRPAAEPGDLTVAVVRAVPWLAVLVVLAAIFLFTAYARTDRQPPTLIGRCVRVEDPVPVAVPCTSPNDGRVIGVVRQANLCTAGSQPRLTGSGDWYCLRAPDAG